MREVVHAGSVIHSARTVGGGMGSRVPATEQRSPHMFPQRKIGPRARWFRGVVAGGYGTRAIAARNVARYSES